MVVWPEIAAKYVATVRKPCTPISEKITNFLSLGERLSLVPFLLLCSTLDHSFMNIEVRISYIKSAYEFLGSLNEQKQLFILKNFVHKNKF